MQALYYSTTGKTSHTNCHKFRVKHQNTYNYITFQSDQKKLVIPVPDQTKV